MTGNNIWAYYDGRCGLCHRAVVFLLRHDRLGRIYFAPTQSERYRELAQAHRISITPRSILVWDPEQQRLLSEAEAVLFLLDATGHSRLADALRLLPAQLLRSGYQLIARLRRHFFREPTSLIPLLPLELTHRVTS